ncbi:MAG: SMC family ATPase [Chloroflexi bacterium]|nr:SMC family ATPase [Chloroflexota bacterium]
MQILALELENTKSYAAAQVDFSAGVNAIVGHNGAGKSTILEAIGFVLFDAIDYKQTEFVRDGFKNASITVTIASSLDERRYQIVRRCGSVNQHYVYDPDLQVKICEGKADVLMFLRRNMGVELNTDLAGLFKDAVGVPQGTFTAVFLDAPARRKITFDPLLQVEEYKQAVDKLLEPMKLLQKRQQNLELQITSLTTRLERLPALQATLQQRASDIVHATTQSSQTEIMLHTVQQERATAETIQQKASLLRNRQIQGKQQQQSQENQLQIAHVAQQQATTARAAVQENLAGYERYLAAQAEQKALDVQVQSRQQLELQHTQLDKTLAVAQADLASLQRDLNTVASAEKSMVDLAPDVQNQFRLERALAVAQQQSSRLEDAKTQLAKQEQELLRLQHRLTALNRQLEQAAHLETERFAGEAQLEQMRQTLDETKETLARYKVEGETLKQQSSALENIATAVCPVCEQPLTAEHRTTLLQRNQTRLEALRADYGQAQHQSKTMEAGQKTLQSHVQKLQQELRRLPRPEEAQAVQQELETGYTALHTLRQYMEQLADAPQQMAQLSEQLAALNNPSQRSAIAAERAKQRPQLENKLEQTTAKMAETQTQLVALQTALLQFANLDKALETVAAEVQRHTVAYQTLLINRQMAATLEARTVEVEQLYQALKLIEQENEQISIELAATEAQFDPAEFQRLLDEERQLRAQYGGLQTKIMMLNQEQQRDQAEVATLQAKQGELLVAQAQKQQWIEQEKTLDSVRGFLKQAGPYITKALIKQISDGAAQTFSEIMQDYSRHLTWNEDYGITLEVEGRARQFAQLSGGEQMSAALAVRLTLLREMSSIDVAFFDEPTTNLDETRRSLLARQILEVKGFRQLFVISHDDSFEQATQNLIRIARVNGASTIVSN